MPARSAPSLQSARRRGFSLVELLLALALLGCLGAVAWPRLEAWRESMELDRATEQVRARFQQGRLAAIETGVAVTVEYHAGARELRSHSRGASTAEPGRRLPEGIGLQAAGADSATDGWQRLTTFRPDGSASAARVTVADDHGIRRVLTIDRATGSVHLQETGHSGEGD